MFPLRAMHAADITRAEVDAWVDWCSGVEAAQLAYVWPMLVPQWPYDKAAYCRGSASLDAHLQALERHLRGGRTYLVGHALTLADILVAWVFIAPYLVVRSRPHSCHWCPPPAWANRQGALHHNAAPTCTATRAGP